MKLIQTPSLITGVILGASLITLSAASNDSALGGLHVFVPGTTVSSADVNDNFTMVVDEVSALEGRVDNLESSSSSSDRILFRGDINGEINFTVPEGYIYAMVGGHYWSVEYKNAAPLREDWGGCYSIEVTGVDGIPDATNVNTSSLLPGDYGSQGLDRIWLYPGTSIRLLPGSAPTTTLTLWVERVAYSVQ
jgi:hypothetical protein